MKLTFSIDLGHGEEYCRQIFIDEKIIIDSKDLKKYLKDEFGYLVNDVASEIVKDLRPEYLAQIFARSLADHNKNKRVCND